MIDKETVAKIIDTADIVEVVSDFVSLRKRGVNYVGLCPFHNEKTPSFSVSKSKGICHCFSCGKGGSPVNFIMEHEQLSYYEALKYLANKYHIEIKERELTDEERAAQSEREGMLIVNEFATNTFETNLYETQEGKDIGLSYFYERGFSDVIIKKFRLGYSLENSNAFYHTAISKGYNRKFLFDTGICIDDKRGGGYDRYKGRVVFPIVNVAGKVIAFSARTLKQDQAKYVNSPDSIIYTKGKELYGLYQAKHSIVRQDKCFLVEGNADVVSMHQAGFDNTVAPLGTGFTINQVQLLHRFTENVTVLFDGDSAGIKAAVKAVKLLLPEGINVRVLLLPDGEDPDSFSRKHNATEFQQYIDEHEEDFVRFMKRVLLGESKDPIKKSEILGDICNSISLIPSELQRSIYIKDCSEIFGVEEKIVSREVAKSISSRRKKELEQKQKNDSANSDIEDKSVALAPDSSILSASHKGLLDSSKSKEIVDILFPYEQDIVRYIVKYGMSDFCALNDDATMISLLQYIKDELIIDDLNFSNENLKYIFNVCTSYMVEFEEDYAEFQQKVFNETSTQYEEGIKEIKQNILSVQDIEQKEKELHAKIELFKHQQFKEFKMNYLEKKLNSHPEDLVRQTALELVREKHSLSKIHSRFTNVKSDFEKLDILVPQAFNNWKNALIECQIKECKQQISSCNDMNEISELMRQIQDFYNLRKELAKYLGDRVVNPKN